MSCSPHNEQVCYQLLKCSQEWTPAFLSPHYLAWNITHLLIYLVYSCFKAMTCSFGGGLPRRLIMYQYTYFSPHLKQYDPPPKKIRLLLLFSSLFPFFSSLKQKVISSVPSLSAAHARRTHYFILLWTLLNLAQKQFFINIFIHLWLLSKFFAYEHTLSLSFVPISLSFSAPHSIQYRFH